VPDFVIIGAGGHGREVHDVFIALQSTDEMKNMNFLGFIDDGNPNIELLKSRGSQLLGNSEILHSLPGVHYVIGIGDPQVRAKLAEKAGSCGLIAHTLIHPNSSFGHNVVIGAGSVICSFASVTSDVTLGIHVHLNRNCTIGHDTIVGDFTSVHPLASISGNVRIGDRVLIGTHGVVLQNLRISANSIVGAGAVVTKDVEHGKTVVGVPAK